MSMLVPNLEELVKRDHIYLKLLKVINFEDLTRPLGKLYSGLGRGGYAVSQGFKCLYLQFYEDKSDREMEDFLSENLAAKLFCGFGLLEETPKRSYFGVLRDRIGTHRLGKLFQRVNESLKRHGYIREVFSFIDASEIRSKINVWEARDKALAEAEAKSPPSSPQAINNSTIGKYGSDSEARFGCKGKDKYWLGFKRHCCVDMTLGLISKVAVTPANLTDADGLKLVCPNQGMAFLDKAYCVKRAQKALKINNCHSGAILKNNMKNKNFKKDAWLSSVRMPFEGTFSKLQKITKFRGIVKNQFRAFFQALTFNLEKLMRMELFNIALLPA